MQYSSLSVLLLTLLTASSSVVSAINPIVVKGYKLFDSVTHQEFFVKGVAYQPLVNGQFADPISDDKSSTWTAHIAMFKDLGINTIRVYEVDNNNSHDAFMKALEAAGIYLIVDLGSGTASINRANPTYTIDLFNSYKARVDAFAKYNNLLGFIGSNEIVNAAGNVTKAAPYAKALVRDIKLYLSGFNRKIPVGYAAADVAEVRVQAFNYFTCGDSASTVDFFGENLYSWCGDSSFTTSGYSDRTNEIKNSNVPVIITEYGCNQPSPRKFTEVAAIYGPDMAPYWSGGVLYEFSEEDNKYGLVQVSSNNQQLPDYSTFKTQLAAVSPQGTSFDSISTSRPAPSCPAQDSNWLASTNLPPYPSSCTCSAMVGSLSCVANQIDPSHVGQALSTACGFLVKADPANGCNDISSGDGQQGVYGKYSFCSTQDQLSYVYNALVKKGSTCDFGGMATAQSPSVSDLSSALANCKTQDATGGNSNAKSTATSISKPLLHFVISTVCAIVISFLI